MIETLKEIFSELYTFDIVYLVFTTLSLIKCTKKGFVLSILSASKWLLAYVLTLFLFPKAKPYLKDIIDPIDSRDAKKIPRRKLLGLES